MQLANELEERDEWEYVEEGPAEIIWQGNENIVKKKKVNILKRGADQLSKEEDDDRHTSNPLPPQSAAFASHKKGQSLSEQRVLENVAQQIPNFGTEQKIKLIALFTLRLGSAVLVHVAVEFTSILISPAHCLSNMYNGPGLAWEQDEGHEV